MYKQRALTGYCEEGKTAEEKGIREQYISGEVGRRAKVSARKWRASSAPFLFYSEAKENPE